MRKLITLAAVLFLAGAGSQAEIREPHCGYEWEKLDTLRPGGQNAPALREDLETLSGHGDELALELRRQKALLERLRKEAETARGHRKDSLEMEMRESRIILNSYSN